MSGLMTVHKLDEKGAEVWSYPARCIEQTDAFIRLEASFDREDVVVGPLRLQREDTFLETFYFKRWFNVFEIYERGSRRFKGWYCNIARPAWIEANHLYAEDLALDLVVTSAGQIEILDRDEFDRLDLTEEDRQQAQDTLQLLEQQAVKQAGIFAGPTQS